MVNLMSSGHKTTTGGFYHHFSNSTTNKAAASRTTTNFGADMTAPGRVALPMKVLAGCPWMGKPPANRTNPENGMRNHHVGPARPFLARRRTRLPLPCSRGPGAVVLLEAWLDVSSNPDSKTRFELQSILPSFSLDSDI